ncbi:hypothetical protein LOD99_15978 [Oopsacas minuta]|uniref:G-protein coupled receptors family 1 profile domain-containing protein n=1 Tax=Oopsacas minuta TaxID=111878 RepID=A0AAV7K7Y6_9METZ|nr:hypothetical protein LOD99_15978 [Oopsacas minuta]
MNITDVIQTKFEQVVVYCITIPSMIGVIIGSINVVHLIRLSRYWYRMRNKTEHTNDGNYKTATVNYVKFGLSSLVLFSEILIVSLIAVGDGLHHISCGFSQEYEIQCMLTDFVDQIVDTFLLVWLIIPLSVVNMLSLFMIEVIGHSNVDTGILRRESMRTFWLCVCLFSLSGIEIDVVNSIGVIVTKLIIIYICWIVYKSMKKLFIALKSKCLDYTYELENLAYFRSQVKHYKWSSLIVGLSGGGFFVSNAILKIHESIFEVYILIKSQQSFFSLVLHKELVSMQIYETVHTGLVIIERIFFVNWALVSTLLNCFLLIIFILQALWYRRSMSKPFHIKLVDSGNGYSVYKKVNY